MGVTSDGEVIKWGGVSSFEAPTTDINGTSAKKISNLLIKAVAIRGGALASGGWALSEQGVVVGWGSRRGGWLGGDVATTSQDSQPEIIDYGTSIAQLGPFTYTASTVLTTGGQVIVSPATSDFVQLSNSASGYGYRYTRAAVPGLSDIVALHEGMLTGTAGKSFYAIQRDGSVWLVSLTVPSTGKTTIATTRISELTNIKSIACSTEWHCLGLKKDGSVVAWGKNDYGQLGDGTTSQVMTMVPQAVPGLSNITKVAASDGVSVAISSDGALWTWGTFTRIGSDPGLATSSPSRSSEISSVEDISCSLYLCFAMTSDGRVWGWGGNNAYGQLGANVPLLAESFPITQVETLDLRP